MSKSALMELTHKARFELYQAQNERTRAFVLADFDVMTPRQKSEIAHELVDHAFFNLAASLISTLKKGDFTDGKLSEIYQAVVIQDAILQETNQLYNLFLQKTAITLIDLFHSKFSLEPFKIPIAGINYELSEEFQNKLLSQIYTLLDWDKEYDIADILNALTVNYMPVVFNNIMLNSSADKKLKYASNIIYNSDDRQTDKTIKYLHDLESYYSKPVLLNMLIRSLNTKLKTKASLSLFVELGCNIDANGFYEQHGKEIMRGPGRFLHKVDIIQNLSGMISDFYNDNRIEVDRLVHLGDYTANSVIINSLPLEDCEILLKNYHNSYIEPNEKKDDSAKNQYVGTLSLFVKRLGLEAAAKHISTISESNFKALILLNDQPYDANKVAKLIPSSRKFLLLEDLGM